MNINRIKLFVIAFFALPLVAVAVFYNGSLLTVSGAPDDVAAVYKTKCAACHSPKAEKHYDPAMPEEEQVNIILKGKKGEKPPYMPAYEEKGITAEQAKELAAYMKNLRATGN